MAQAVSKDVMLGRLKQVGCEVIEEGAISIEMAHSGSTFFIPQPPDGIYYTDKQVNKIEAALAYYGIDLLPFDYNLN